MILDPAEAADGDAAGVRFETRYARFDPVGFDELPDWHKDEVRDAFQAFLRGCRTLATRRLWSETCARAKQLEGASTAAVRSFLEERFVLYQVKDKRGMDDGVITGYYEPLLRGSRTYSERFRYPVYAVPNDLLYLDTRQLAKDHHTRPIYVRIQGRNVVPVPAAVGPGSGLLQLDPSGPRPNVRDKRMRLRVEGGHVVPYYTRAEIDSSRLPSARVLVWVDDPAMLYTMHLQGIGRVVLPDGQVVRLAYADQNGHAFRSKIKRVRANTQTAAAQLPMRIKTRGGTTVVADVDPEAIDPPVGDDEEAEYDSVEAEWDQEDPRGGLRGVKIERDMPAPSLPAVAAPTAAPTVPAVPSVSDSPWPRTGSLQSASARPAPQPAQPAGSQPAPRTAGNAGTRAGAKDPSYLFFREVPDGPEGPVGALGVPLTPGRSLAVDPRITPLGAPVFLSTQHPVRDALMNRLVVAQDTGGAIRGPLRADYFFGAGPSAGALAHRMKHEGRLWLLLPKSFRPSATMQLAVRGEGGVECVVSDPEFCVDELASADPAASTAP